MVDASLREHFDRAVADDPGIDPGEMAHMAIAEGGRMRRRRRRVVVAGAAAGLVTMLGAVAGLNLLTEAPRSESPPAAMLPVAAPGCSAKPVDRDATDVLIVLAGDATDRQRSALKSALEGDARVDVLVFENRAEAFERFRNLWANSPEVVPVDGAGQFAESYRLRLVDASRYTAFRGQYAAMGGVGQIIGRVCPPSAPVGGVL